MPLPSPEKSSAFVTSNGARGLPDAAQIHSRKLRALLHDLRRIPVGDHPDVIATMHINRRDPADVKYIIVSPREST